MKERSGERSAACSVCGKTFARSDTLVRHEKSHHATEDRGPVHRVTNGTFRACSACAAARSRCSGGSPCGRCNIRNTECIYPTKRRRGGDHIPVLKLDDSAGASQQHLQQFQDASIAGRNPAASQIRFADPTESSPHPPSHPDQSPHSGRDSSFQKTFGDQASYREGYPLEPSASRQENTMPAPTSVSQLQSAQTHIHPDQQYPDPESSGQYQPDYGTGSYDYSTFEDSLNWIPISVFPSPYENEFEHDVSFLFPTIPDAIGLEYSADVSTESSQHLYKAPEPVPQFEVHATRSHEFPAAVLGPGQSPTASSASNEHSATKSMTGSTGTGDAKKKRRKSSVVPDLFTQPRNRTTTYAFPKLSIHDSATDSASPVQYCSRPTYDFISNLFRRLCLDTLLLPRFDSDNFPDVHSLNAWVDLYFDHFNSSFPLIHKPTFSTDHHWVVVLATAAIGSTFVKAPYSVDLREAFQELLRRAIHHCADGAADHALDLPLAQARILNLIGLAQSDRDQLRSLAPRYHADLSRWCLESGILQISEKGESGEGVPRPDGVWHEWEKWIRTESLRRVGYLTWLLDTSLAYLANCRPLCNMDDARTPLPCSEALWNAQNSGDWQSLHQQDPHPSPSLCAALEHLYAKKTINPHLSDISQILLINALFQRTWEVGTHIKQPLSEWVPTGKARGFLNTPSKDSFWLPLYPLYANWRNSACDCLDVLHWHAASIVARASGVEHHLMLHLHLARIILLTPFQEIQDLVFSLINRVGHSARASFYVHDGSYQPRSQAKLPQIRRITWRWLREDQHKARLAMIHAGSVFWHVRRYSSGSFYEPLAVYLASMVLWTYGSYKSAALEREMRESGQGGPSGEGNDDLSVVQPSRVERKVSRSTGTAVPKAQAHSQPHKDHSPDGPHPPQPSSRTPSQPPSSPASSSSSSESSSPPHFIHLDRPCDDEMIQHFVRSGHTMTSHMQNVGDICRSPNKVLLEGAKLLRGKLGGWGVSREYWEVLRALGER